MKPGYQEQILYILNKHHSIVTVELGDAVTDDILRLIDSAKREARIEEIKYLAQGEPDRHWYIDLSDQEIHDRIALLEQSEESK
jgi:hypothetical protein